MCIIYNCQHICFLETNNEAEGIEKNEDAEVDDDEWEEDEDDIEGAYSFSFWDFFPKCTKLSFLAQQN